MKNHAITILCMLILCLFAFSCNTIEPADGGKTFRYIYKGATLYKFIDRKNRGDSVGTLDQTVLSPLYEYLSVFKTGKKYWLFEYKDSLYLVDMNNSGWTNYSLEDKNSKFGRLIVKTLILEGEKSGQEKVSMRILIMDTNINKNDVEYAPTISADGRTLYFVSKNDGSRQHPNGENSHDFWAAIKENKYDSVFSTPYNIDTTSYANINTILNEGVATIAADNRTLFFTGCDREDGYGNCDIYSARIFEGKWSKLRNLGGNVNSKYWESQPAISPDGKVLYFVSNREGPNGYENFDIWYSLWDELWEEWGPALNLSQINTKGKDVAPFIAADGVTMFFSSNELDSCIGGLDFYVTKFDAEAQVWSKPAHLQRPLNSEDDDQFISMPASGDIIYFSSRRTDIPGYQGDLDLFMAYVESYFKAIVLKIYVADDSDVNISTTITVDNPISRRKVVERVTEKDNVLSMVLTNADYGDTKDSLQYIDLKIQAQHDIFGKKQKIMRVKNPMLDTNKAGWVFNNEIDETFEMSVSPELDKYLRSLKRSILDATVKVFTPKKDSVMDNKELVIEEFQSSNTIPILPYFFFSKDSSKIPDKYKKLAKEKSMSFSVDNLEDSGTLTIYYELLNIIGSRMKNYTEANLMLNGCNSNSENEKGNLELSKQRAENIKKYLVDVWSIDPSRIQTTARNLPENPSNSSTPEGMEENRRVECYSDDDRILEPVTTIDLIKIAKPESINFESTVSVKGGEASWTLNIIQDRKILKSFNGEGSMHQDLLWDLNKEKETLPQNESPLMIELLVKDKKRDKTIVAKGEIAVRQITTKLKKAEYTEDKRIDKYRLILFDFGKSNLNKGNLSTIERIKSNIIDKSKLTLIGYSDRLGNDAYNLKLSEKRAVETANALGVMDLDLRAIGEGQLLYDNDLPEGRFYCRTVEIIAETPIKADSKK